MFNLVHAIVVALLPAMAEWTPLALLAALAINASPCIKTSNLLHRFGHFLERSSDEDGGGDGVLFANSVCALSMLEDAAERDALIETESDVSDRMQRYRDAYLVAEDELRRANAALCGRRLRKMEARGDATGSGEGGGAPSTHISCLGARAVRERSVRWLAALLCTCSACLGGASERDAAAPVSHACRPSVSSRALSCAV